MYMSLHILVMTIIIILQWFQDSCSVSLEPLHLFHAESQQRGYFVVVVAVAGAQEWQDWILFPSSSSIEINDQYPNGEIIHSVHCHPLLCHQPWSFCQVEAPLSTQAAIAPIPAPQLMQSDRHSRNVPLFPPRIMSSGSQSSSSSPSTWISLLVCLLGDSLLRSEFDVICINSKSQIMIQRRMVVRKFLT